MAYIDLSLDSVIRRIVILRIFFFSSFCVVFKNIYKGYDMCVCPGAFNFVHVQTRVQPKKLRIVEAYLGKISIRSCVQYI